MKETSQIYGEYEDALRQTGDLGGTEISHGMITDYRPEVRKNKLNDLKDWAKDHHKTIAVISGISGAISFIVGTGWMFKHMKGREDIEVVSLDENDSGQSKE